MTSPAVFIPARSSMYCLSRDATISTSSVFALVGADVGTMRRRASGSPAETLVATLAAAKLAAASVGARRSSHHASRWFMVGTCASQHATLQKTQATRGRLHVETEQT